MKYAKVRSRISASYESFRKGRKLLVRFNILGKTLRVYLALDPNEYPVTVYHQRDDGSKKQYELVPKLENQRTVATGYNMLAKERSFDIVTSEPVTVLKKKTESEQESKYEVSLNEEVKLPIEAGQQVGTLTYYYNGKAYKEVPLTVKETVEKNSFIGLFGYIVSKILFGENA